MIHADPHDARKADIEDRLIQTAELKAQEAETYKGIGKAAYDAYNKFWVTGDWDWSRLTDRQQCAWVEAAKAAVRANLENNE